MDASQPQKRKINKASVASLATGLFSLVIPLFIPPISFSLLPNFSHWSITRNYDAAILSHQIDRWAYILGGVLTLLTIVLVTLAIVQIFKEKQKGIAFALVGLVFSLSFPIFTVLILSAMPK